MSEDGLTEDVLFLACTRPAMWQGVPLEAVCLNAMGTVIFFVLMKNPFYMLIGVVGHYILRYLVREDYNLFTVARLWMETKGRSRHSAKWGGSSVSPLPLRPARSGREVRIHV